MFPDLALVSSISPRGNDRPSARSNVSHSPVRFIEEMGDAARSLGAADATLRPLRPERLRGDLGGAAVPVASPDNTDLAQGDYEKLMAALTSAFAGTVQPVPGTDGVTVWYLETGFQTSVPVDKRGLYTGSENDRRRPRPRTGGHRRRPDERRLGRLGSGFAARGRDPPRVLSARRRGLLQLPARRRARPRRLAVRRALGRRHAEAVVRRRQARNRGCRHRDTRLRRARGARRARLTNAGAPWPPGRPLSVYRRMRSARSGGHPRRRRSTVEWRSTTTRRPEPPRPRRGNRQPGEPRGASRRPSRSRCRAIRG